MILNALLKISPFIVSIGLWVIIYLLSEELFKFLVISVGIGMVILAISCDRKPNNYEYITVSQH